MTSLPSPGSLAAAFALALTCAFALSLAGWAPVLGRQAPAFQAAVVNDNYTGSEEHGAEGFYIGADDFLTVSFLGDAAWGPHRFFLAYNVVTSRKQDFRYDLLTARYGRSHAFGPWRALAGIELVYRGTLGGEWVQNSFHDLMQLPPVELRYRGDGWALSTQWELDHIWADLFAPGERWTLGSEARFPTGLVPVRFGVRGSYKKLWSRISAEALLGLRWYPVELEGYTDFIRSGPLGGAMLRARMWRQAEFGFGALVFPSENLENDPLYRNKSHRWSPQMYTVFSWNAMEQGLGSLLGYF